MTTLTNLPSVPQRPTRGASPLSGIGPKLKPFAPLLLLAVMLLAVLVGEPSFFVGRGFVVLAAQAVPVMLLALGQAMVLMLGGIDLSSAALAVLSAIIVASVIGSLSWVALPFTIAAGALAGALVGLITSVFQVPSFAVTLGALGVWTSCSLVFSGSTTVYVDRNAWAVAWPTEWALAGFPLSVYVAIGVGIILALVLKYTRFGRNLRAVGLNERAALMSGCNVVGVKTAAFAISGACAALAGIMLTAQQGTATASGVGTGLLLPGIAAAIVGGVAITGGVGNPLNVLIGGLVISLVPIGSSAVGVDPQTQRIVYGVLVVAAVLVTIDRSHIRIIK